MSNSISGRFNTPILYVFFNRPASVEQSVEPLRKLRPSKIFLAADGPRKGVPEDEPMCEASRRLVERAIDWPCELVKWYEPINRGLGLQVSDSVTKILDQEETVIVLEDDCVADGTFFDFCEELLGYYETYENIFSISGTSFLCSELKKLQSSYYFSMFPYSWGWATWRRAWRYYDYHITRWAENPNPQYFEAIRRDNEFLRNMEFIFNRISQDRLDTWDYQWLYSILLNRGLNIVPKQNLVRNIGFSSLATNTKSEYFACRSIPERRMLYPLKHPTQIEANNRLDRKMFDLMLNYKPSWLTRLKRNAWRLWHH